MCAALGAVLCGVSVTLLAWWFLFSPVSRAWTSDILQIPSEKVSAEQLQGPGPTPFWQIPGK